MRKFINLDVLSNPVNWLTIGLMIVLVAMAALVIYSKLHAPAPEPSNMQKEA